MTQEDKQLLLQDLCARLPYKVRVNYGGYEGCDCKLTLTTLQDFPTEDLKPYLRPMSSMTEEERKEYKHLVAFSGNPDGAANFVDWLNKKMFDFRGLIPKGLAISTEEFNPYNDIKD